jgi:cytochrome c biogenesis protein CcmG/thiol:disulfide interchange protein DsbE
MENNNQEQDGLNDPLSALQPEDGWHPDTSRGLARLRDQRDRRSHRRRRGAAVLAAGAVTALGLMAFPAPRAFAQRCVEACSSEAANLHHALADFHRDPYNGLMKLHNHLFWTVHNFFHTVARVDVKAHTDRKIAPDFFLTDASGKGVRLSDYKGKVVLLNFWATWCAPCREETPWFVDFQSKYRDRDFVVLGVSLDEDGWTSVKPFMESKHVNYPVVIGNSEVGDLYGVKNLPETFIIDESGRIAVNCTGLIGKDEYRNEIEALLR